MKVCLIGDFGTATFTLESKVRGEGTFPKIIRDETPQLDMYGFLF